MMRAKDIFLRIGVAVVLLTPLAIGGFYGYNTSEVVDCSTYSDMSYFGNSPQDYCNAMHGSEFTQRLEKAMGYGIAAYIPIVLAGAFVVITDTVAKSLEDLEEKTDED